MKFKGIMRKIKRATVPLLAVAMTMGCIVGNVSVAQAEEIIHTHIWATKYNADKHWDYCTVCNKTRNSVSHTFEDHWQIGYETCHKSTQNNYSTRICACGYSYIYRKPHTEENKWYSTGNRMVHYKKCSSCNNWTKSERCKDAEGYLSCKNPGVCTTCHNTTTKDNHYITEGGKCRDCKKQFILASQCNVTYDSQYTKATVTYKITPVDNSVILTGAMSAYCSDINYTNHKWSYVKNSDGSVNYTGVYPFDSTKQRIATLAIASNYKAIKINNVAVYLDSKLVKAQIWQDHVKPTVTEIIQVDQTKCNGWATIKELTINGNENLSKHVTISIIDKASGDIIVDKAKTSVKNGKYSYKCTPPLEGPVEGRTYTLKVVDQVNNTLEKDFIIYKTDCRAPLLRSEKEYTQWSQTKNLVLQLTDYGAGSAQTSLNNQTSYKATQLSNGYYNASYTFAEENYDVKEYKLYVRDGLGNAALETIKVGRIDNTKPTVTSIKDSKNYEVSATVIGVDSPSQNPIGAIITIEANDMNTTLNKEGSKVAGYALTQTKVQPTNEQWQTSNVIEVKEPSIYYVWVKDGAGNIADVRSLKVKEDFSVEYDPEEPIVVDPEKPTNPTPEDDNPKLAPKNPVDNTDKTNNKSEDNTPKTGDSTNLMLIGGVMIVSIVCLIGSIRRKRMR